MFCTRLANGGLFPTGDPIVPFVISPRFECLNTQSCFTYTVRTFFCSRVLKKLTFFKPLPFSVKIVLGRISFQSFLLIFSSILRQTYQNAYLLRKFRISNLWTHSVDVYKSTQCFKFVQCGHILLSGPHFVCYTKTHTLFAHGTIPQNCSQVKIRLTKLTK